MFPVLAFILLSLVLFILYERYGRTGQLLSNIPGPKRWPIVGNSLHFSLQPDELFIFVRALYKQYGGLIQIHAANFRMVCVYNPEDIEKILSSIHYIQKSTIYNFLKPWLGEGLLTSVGIKWHKRRKLLTPAFHFNVLKKYSRTFTEETDVFLKKIEAEVGNSHTDIQPLICSSTLRIMCETAMGTSMNEGIESVKETYIEAVKIIGDSIVQRLCKAWLHLDVIFNLTTIAREQKAALLDLHTFTDKIINERKQFLKDRKLDQVGDYENVGRQGRLAFLDLLIENEKLGNIHKEGIREEVDTFMFEGHDTTCVALSFLIMAIANEAKIQEKIYDEMYNIFGSSDRPATIQDLHEMPYLECCIKESLRLYPSVPFISRNITEELNLSGYTVPANTNYQICIYELHHRADLYPDPERFIPERFLPENCSKRHSYAYIPFSAGPRNCIGQKFAMLEIKILMSSLIRRFRIEAVTKPSDIKYKNDLVLRTVQPIFVRFYNRDN